MSAPHPLLAPDPGAPAPDSSAGTVGVRVWRVEDAPVLAQAWAEADVARWTGVPADRSVAAAERWIRGETERRERGIALDLAVTDLSDHRVVGEVGLGPIQWDRGRAMLGYWTAPAERCRGVATEAVRLLAAWTRSIDGIDQLVAETAGGNPASGAVLRANGFDLVVERGDRRAWTLATAGQRP
ncbi:MAG: GNAT family N-acetyltransferase [Actinomycetota bacterium]